MKTAYFTMENIEAKSREMVQDLFQTHHPREYRIHPRHTALLVMDMQRYFLNQRSHAYIPSAQPVLVKIKSLADLSVAKGIPVIYTRHLNTRNNAGQMKTWWQDLIREDNPDSEIVPEVFHAGSTIIPKSQYDGFFQTGLADALSATGAKQLIITGVMTHLCCETTARSAFVRGYEVIFPVDGTATANEHFHRCSLRNLYHGFAVPAFMDDIIGRLEKIRNGE